MTFEVVTVSLGEDSVSVALSLMPLTFVDIFVRVDHATFALGQAVSRVAVVTISVFVEESTSSRLFVLIPIARVFSSEFVALVLPVSALAVSLVDSPHSLVLISIFVKLDAKALFAIVAPVAYVFLT